MAPGAEGPLAGGGTRARPPEPGELLGSAVLGPQALGEEQPPGPPPSSGVRPRKWV